jgi:hypothetical protein
MRINIRNIEQTIEDKLARLGIEKIANFEIMLFIFLAFLLLIILFT